MSGDADDDLSASAPGGVTAKPHDDGVVEVLFERPGGNRLSWAAIRDLTAVFAASAAGARAWWLHAGGDDFSFGADLTDATLAAKMAERSGRETVETSGQTLLRTVQRTYAPVVASARGRVIGGGAGLFCACDFRFAAPGTTLWFPEVERGMYLGWGILPLLVREFGWPLARELALGARPITVERLVPAVTIVPAGVDVDHAALDFAHALAAKPPLAVQGIKDGLQQLWEKGELPSAFDLQRFVQTTGSEDFAEAMAAFFVKRPGNYKGR